MNRFSNVLRRFKPARTPRQEYHPDNSDVGSVSSVPYPMATSSPVDMPAQSSGARPDVYWVNG